MDKITTYDLTTVDEAIRDHDTVCTIQAGNLLQHGYLGYETAVYGTTVYKDDDVYYFISSKEEKLHQFRRYCCHNNLISTPIQYFVKRFDGTQKTKEELEQRFKWETAKQMQARYPAIFFAALKEVSDNCGNNTAYPILLQVAKQLENSFDSHLLKLFDKLLEMMLEGRFLNLDSYEKLQQWLAKEQQKTDAEPIFRGAYQRTYWGFAYQCGTSPIKYFADATSYRALEKQQELLAGGYLVTPILEHCYHTDSYQNLTPTRQLFRQSLQKYLDDAYLQLMAYLRRLPCSINREKYFFYLQYWQNAHLPDALALWRYFGYLWNALV